MKIAAALIILYFVFYTIQAVEEHDIGILWNAIIDFASDVYEMAAAIGSVLLVFVIIIIEIVLGDWQ